VSEEEVVSEGDVGVIPGLVEDVPLRNGQHADFVLSSGGVASEANCGVERVVGSLQKCWREWEKLGVAQWLVNAVRWGVVVPLKPGWVFSEARQPVLEEEKLAWLDCHVAELLADGVVDVVPAGKEVFCSPIFLVPKPGPKKWRVVHNLKRWNNGVVDTPKVKYLGLDTLLRSVRKGWWAFTLDFKSGFHHLSLHPSMWKWMGFRHRGLKYWYKVTGFGGKMTPGLFKKHTDVLVRELRAQGARVGLWVDDMICVFPSKEQALVFRDEVLVVWLKRLGWVRCPEKGEWEPSQRVEWIGYVIDLMAGTVGLKEERKVKVVSVLDEVLGLVVGGKKVGRRLLAKVAGMVVSAGRALPVVRPLTRSLFKDIGIEGNWWGSVWVSEEGVEDLRMLREAVLCWGEAEAWMPERVEVLRSDAAGDVGWGGWCVEGFALGQWDGKEREKGIFWKEVVGAVNTFLCYGEKFVGRKVRLEVDNQGAAYALWKGSRYVEVNREVRKLWLAAVRWGVVLLPPRWIPREWNEAADWLSKVVDYEDWVVEDWVYSLAVERWGVCDVDRFASAKNAKCRQWNSHWMEPGTSGVDALTQDWSLGLSWVVPPARVIHQVLSLVGQQGAEVVMVIPLWKRSEWWLMVDEMLVDGVCLGRSDAGWCRAGPANSVEPWKNISWEYGLMRLSGKRWGKC
jgi:hypothetical protein